MSEKISLALKAGLLHDVGKVCIRATHERQRHSILGAEFIRSFLADTEADKQLLRCIKYHHGRELSAPDWILMIWHMLYMKRIILLPVQTGGKRKEILMTGVRSLIPICAWKIYLMSFRGTRNRLIFLYVN